MRPMVLSPMDFFPAGWLAMAAKKEKLTVTIVAIKSGLGLGLGLGVELVSGLQPGSGSVLGLEACLIGVGLG